MQISWVLLAENIVVKEESQRVDIIGEFRSVEAEDLPLRLPKFFIFSRIEGNVNENVSATYELKLHRPSNELVELHSSKLSLEVPPGAGTIVGNLIAEIQNFDFVDSGKHTLIAQLGDSSFNTDIMVFRRRNGANDE